MSKKFQYECESVDLTEDEDDDEDDSCDKKVPSQIGSRNFGHRSKIINLNPPPLIPIPRISAPKTTTSASIVPTLTKIQSQGEAPKVADSLATNTIFSRNVTLVESPHSNLTSIPTTQMPSTPGGKVILIKKNNKLYKIVIPHNVMLSSDAGGPVVINIPEVGPLVIKIDPQAKNQPVANPASVIEPFSLKFDDIIEKASMGEAVEERLAAKNATTDKVFSAADKPFPCWTAPAARTRTKNTFNGFSKRELANSKRCLNQLNNFIIKYKRKLVANRHVMETDPKRNTDSFKDFDSLLMTKKVVVLNGYRRNTLRKSARKRKSEKINLRPVVRITRCESLENRYRHLIKPCFVNVKRCDQPPVVSEQSPGTLARRRDLYLSRMIKDVRTFSTLMAFIKPVLVMNEFNYSIVNFKNEFCKANLVYPVGEDRRFPDKILASTEFRNAVANDYVKLVDAGILCRYFKGEVGPSASLV